MASDGAHDAVNCLYLQVAILGQPAEYARVREAVFVKGGAVSIVSLRDAAGRCGLPMKIVRCGPGELRRMPKPVIVYMHGTRGGGGFALLFDLNDERCGLIEGGKTRSGWWKSTRSGESGAGSRSYANLPTMAG